VSLPVIVYSSLPPFLPRILTGQITDGYPDVHIKLYQFPFTHMLENVLPEDVHKPFGRDFGKDAPVDVHGFDTLVSHLAVDLLEGVWRQKLQCPAQTAFALGGVSGQDQYVMLDRQL